MVAICLTTKSCSMETRNVSEETSSLADRVTFLAGFYHWARGNHQFYFRTTFGWEACRRNKLDGGVAKNTSQSSITQSVDFVRPLSKLQTLKKNVLNVSALYP